MNVHCAFVRIFSIFLVLLLVTGMAPGSAEAAPRAAWVVNDGRDGVNGAADGACDAYPGEVGSQCTLRESITEANASAGSDTITFSGSFTFQPAAAYPDLSGSITLSGVGQTIVLDGTALPPGSSVLRLAGMGNTVQGLKISGSAIGIEVPGSNNMIGTDGDGSDDASESNIIVSCSSYGILLNGSAAHDNVIAGNKIGTDGASAFPNGDGVHLTGGAHHNYIGTNGDGTSDEQEKNLISGNSMSGVVLNGTDTNDNIVAGNWIGVNLTGTAAMANIGRGVNIYNGASRNRIGTDGNGGSDALEKNLISGNSQFGVQIFGVGTNNNILAGNWIGLNAAGDNIIPNTAGVSVEGGAQGTVIGTNLSGGNDGAEGNVISGNQLFGISLSGAATNGTIIQGNLIGLSADGLDALGNQWDGITVTNSGSAVIGWSGAGYNYIGGNQRNGISVANSSSISLHFNLIGMNATMNAAPNAQNGIAVSGSNPGLIVTNNYISYNQLAGVSLAENAKTGNNIQHTNSIHANGGLGIDLQGDGVTPNDPGDGDDGVNSLLNYPVLHSVFLLDEDTIQVNGTLNSTPSSEFVITLYANAACNPSGYGEGQTWIHLFVVTTDANGNASFSQVMNYHLLYAYPVITANTRDANYNVSEFSACKTAVTPQNIYIPFVKR